MKRCLFVYFSQRGSTEALVKRIAAGISAGGYQVELHNLQNGPVPNIGEFQLLGIGAPVYYFQPTFIVMDFINSLPQLDNVPVFTVLTYGTVKGDAGTTLRKALLKKGCREVGYMSSKGADYFLAYTKRGYMFSPNHPDQEELGAADRFGADCVAIAEGRKNYEMPAFEKGPPMMYRMERSLIPRFAVKAMYTKMFSVNKKLCTECGICVKVCPTKNITGVKKNELKWGSKCILCLSCEAKCPEDAISSPVTSMMFAATMVYNLHDARKTPGLDFVQVTHSKGKTTKVSP